MQFKTKAQPPDVTTKNSPFKFSSHLLSIPVNPLPESLNITHCWHIFDFKHLELFKIRSEGHCKEAELWNLLLSAHKCFVSHLLFGDACGFLNLVSLQTCSSWLKFKRG